MTPRSRASPSRPEEDSRSKRRQRRVLPSQVPAERADAIVALVSHGADQAGVEVPRVRIVLTSGSARMARRRYGWTLEVDAWLAASAPLEVCAGVVGHELGHLVHQDTGAVRRRRRGIGLAWVATGLLAWAALVVAVAAPRSAWALRLAIAWPAMAVVVLTGVVLDGRLRRSGERAADRVGVELVGSDAYAAKLSWMGQHYRQPSRWVGWAEEHPPLTDRLAMARAMSAERGGLLDVLDDLGGDGDGGAGDDVG